MAHQVRGVNELQASKIPFILSGHDDVPFLFLNVVDDSTCSPCLSDNVTLHVLSDNLDDDGEQGGRVAGMTHLRSLSLFTLHADGMRE